MIANVKEINLKYQLEYHQLAKNMFQMKNLSLFILGFFFGFSLSSIIEKISESYCPQKNFLQFAFPREFEEFNESEYVGDTPMTEVGTGEGGATTSTIRIGRWQKLFVT